jgi:hypothetical protein
MKQQQAAAAPVPAAVPTGGVSAGPSREDRRAAIQRTIDRLEALLAALRKN